MYKDETGHNSNFFVTDLIVLLQRGNKGGEEEGEVGKYVTVYAEIGHMSVFS